MDMTYNFETAQSTDSGDGKACCMTVPILNGDYVQTTIQSTGVPTIFWVPDGIGGLVKQ